LAWLIVFLHDERIGLKDNRIHEKSETTLVSNLQNGDEKAFVILYHRYKHSVYAYSMKMLGNPDAAKDVVQGVFLKLFERSNQIRNPERFRIWLFTMVRNDCLVYLKREGVYAEGRDNTSNDDSKGIENQSCDPTNNELAHLVKLALRKLSPEHREVLILREYQSLSYREIADVINTTESNVKFRLFTARRKLFEILKPMFKRTAKDELR
jgi:RNA polymerase sigma-70 factor (ECF subfamily)